MKSPFNIHEIYGIFYVRIDDAQFFTLPVGSTKTDAERLLLCINTAYTIGFGDGQVERESHDKT